MASFTVSGLEYAGQPFTVTNATAPVGSDTFTINGIKQTVSEWTRCGVIKFMSTVSTTHTYYLMASPEIVGQQAG